MVRRALPPPGALFVAGAAAPLSEEVERRRAGCGAGPGQDSSGDFLDERDGQRDGGQKPNLLVTSAVPDDD